MRWTAAVGVATSNALYAAPLASVVGRVRAGTLGALNPLPSALSLLATAAWTQYALLVADPFLVAANAPGFAMALAGVALLLPLLADDARLRRMQTTVVVGVSAMAALSIAFVFADPTLDTQTDIIGGLALGLFMALSIAPLSTLRTVLATKDASTIYAPLAVAQTVNCALWVVYGACALRDPFVWLPNALGALLGAGQLLLVLACRPTAG